MATRNVLAGFDAQALWTALDALPGGATGTDYRVACSGGLDSTVLVVAMAELRPLLGSAQLSVVHVDHGLHADSGAWAEAAVHTCTSLGVPCRVVTVSAHPAPGESPEAAARQARYRALARDLGARDALLTAHHADDQLETVLLQLLRGAGVAGLAAMPADAPLGAGRHRRPLLGFTRAALEAWARARCLVWMEDPANRELRYSRSRLRHEVLPALRAGWPAAAKAVARSAAHCAEAAALLDELGRSDAAGCRDGNALGVAALADLPAARRRNAVRYEVRRAGLPMPDHRRLEALLDQMLTARPEAAPVVRWPGAAGCRYRGRLWLIPGVWLDPPPAPLPWHDQTEPLSLGGGLGELAVEETQDGGLLCAALDLRPWRVAFRAGGERIRLAGQAHRRPLKKILNEAGIPPWFRSRMPLIEVGDSLAAVSDRWIAAEWWSPPGNKALRIAWRGAPDFS